MTSSRTPPHLPPSLAIHMLFFLLSVTISDGLHEITTTVSGCPSFTCGDNVITYPFWVSRDQPDPPPSYCGYPARRLRCSNDAPILNLDGNDYAVTAINYSTHTLDLSILPEPSACPRPLRNLTSGCLESSSLTYTASDTNLTFFFNCSNASPEHPITCLENGGNRSYVFPDDAIPPGYNWATECQEAVVAPVLHEAVVESLFSLYLVFGAILRRGFQLHWRHASGDECARCEGSGGWCGFNISAAPFSGFVCFCRHGWAPRQRLRRCAEEHGHTILKIVIGVIAGISGLILGFIFLFLYIWRDKKFHNHIRLGNKKSNIARRIESLLEKYGSLAPKRYNYSDVKKMTKSFSNKLGQGGYGVVYKGELHDGHPVAVKVLSSSTSNGEEFVNEVASIGKTSHVNVVSLLGFCYEGSKRALIFDFMPNGSLEKFICAERSETTPLGWENLLKIAVGIARGLEYLHRGCNTRIVHFDIKPHNILLDQDFCPKISDFGLAKLCPPKESIISMCGARGTAGYIAPEVFSRNFGVVSSKSDVYSFGMMLLEMVGVKIIINAEARNTSETYFPHWIYEHLDQDGDLRVFGVTGETKDIALKMILVGLWCIQTNPQNRPSISRVLEMFEGSISGLEMPPKPYLTSMVRSFSSSSTVTIEECNSKLV